MTDLFTRFRRGWTLTKASLQVLRLDTEILLLPVLSAFVMILLAGGVLGSLFLGGTQMGTGAWVAGFLVLYFVGYFVVIFFNAAVVAMATMRFDGKDPTVRDGLQVSWSRIGKIAQWALLAATVGLVLRMLRGELRQRWGPLVDAIVGGLLETAWNALIYFVVPLLVYRDLGPLDAIRESGGIMRRAWGETAAGEIGMTAVFGLLGLAGLAVLLLLAWAGVAGVVLLAAFVVVVLYWLILAVVYTAAQGILTAAIYKYATTGQVPQGFDHGSVAGAFA
ncbi:MAG: DUF6159 family protein [Halobacteriales archaeon]|nr:DUF6159 family protein [Halobacteriales archaeon]